jgi:CHAT domain-containing protein/uncharacterized protein YqcC (DUF446 family)
VISLFQSLLFFTLFAGFSFFNLCVAQSHESAIQAYYQGAYQQAIKQWQKILTTPPQNSDDLATWLALARAYRYIGAYDKSLEVINTALSVTENTAKRPANAPFHVLFINELSKLRFAQGERWYEEAKQLLEKALHQAYNLRQPQLLAEVLNHQGSLLTANFSYEAALTAYQEALTLLNQSKGSLISWQDKNDLVGKIQVNLAQTLSLLEAELAYQYDDKKQAIKGSLQALEQAIQSANHWQEVYSQIFALIRLSQIAQNLKKQAPVLSSQLVLLAHQSLMKAKSLARQLNNKIAKAHVHGYLGQLYEQAQRYDEALVLTRQALFFAQQTRQQALLYYWEWQLGRILNLKGDRLGAIAAYQQAVNDLTPVRFQIATTGYLTKDQTFRQQIAPIYFELSDLLLQEARATKSNKKRHEKLLRRARTTVETFKEAELQDYFQTECVESSSECPALEKLVDKNTAVLYPIPLADRLELLIHLPTGLEQVTVAVAEKTLRDQIAFFVAPLRHRPDEKVLARGDSLDKKASSIPILAYSYLKPAQTLYQWLIEPLSDKLTQYHIETLVIIPDGALRTMPFSALHDGKAYLIEKYALVIAPGLCLEGTQTSLSKKSKKPQVLLGGLSEAVQNFSPLPYAQYELKQLRNLLEIPEEPLLNQTFTLDNITKKMKETGYSIVHIASHGQFSANLENTFILTYNGQLSMDKLQRLMSLKTLQDTPVDLLALSACETAVGDDRAALGLAGVALKAGVKSALASLWKVDDEATPFLVLEFYRQLQKPGVSKAKALQNAQQKMLTQSRHKHYHHPYFWSPFLLIGSGW